MPISKILISGVAAPQTVPAARLQDVFTLSNQDNDGVSAWQWELFSAPPGSGAALSGATSPTVSVQPDVEGTYIFKLTVNGGGLPELETTATLAVSEALDPDARQVAFEERMEAGPAGWAPAVNYLVRQQARLRALSKKLYVAVHVGYAGTGAETVWTVVDFDFLPTGQVVPVVMPACAAAPALSGALLVRPASISPVSAGQLFYAHAFGLVDDYQFSGSPANGDPVYLSDTQGELSLSPGTVPRAVGYAVRNPAAGATYRLYLVGSVSISGGGVAGVTSVNGKSGAVTLNNSDVDAAAYSHSHTTSSITSGVFTVARGGTGLGTGQTGGAGNVLTSDGSKWVSLPPAGGGGGGGTLPSAPPIAGFALSSDRDSAVKWEKGFGCTNHIFSTEGPWAFTVGDKIGIRRHPSDPEFVATVAPGDAADLTVMTSDELTTLLRAAGDLPVDAVGSRIKIHGDSIVPSEFTEITQSTGGFVSAGLPVGRVYGSGALPPVAKFTVAPPYTFLGGETVIVERRGKSFTATMLSSTVSLEDVLALVTGAPGFGEVGVQVRDPGDGPIFTVDSGSSREGFRLEGTALSTLGISSGYRSGDGGSLNEDALSGGGGGGGGGTILSTAMTRKIVTGTVLDETSILEEFIHPIPEVMLLGSGGCDGTDPETDYCELIFWNVALVEAIPVLTGVDGAGDPIMSTALKIGGTFAKFESFCALGENTHVQIRARLVGDATKATLGTLLFVEAGGGGGE